VARKHTVQQGECISYIAHANGFVPCTLWQHTDNRELREKRSDPNVLLPGDVVVVPDRTVRYVKCATGKKHTFRRKGIPEVLDLQLRDAHDEPRSYEPYELIIEGRESVYGETDENGRLYERMPWNAAKATLRLRDGQETYELSLRHLDPLSTDGAANPSGIQARLNNLGYSCGEVTDTLGERTKIALYCFQIDSGLEPSGEPDEATLSALEAAHGC
jgi:hypothetical protein